MQIKILALGGSSDIAVLGALDAGAQVSNIRCAISRCRFMTAIGKLNMDFPNARVRSRR
jgi:hypothetical protein